jgi:hypothetical protein
MKIRMPKVRAYYSASQNEPEWLLCWIPPDDLAQLASQGRVQSDILDDYPNGLEVEVTDQGFEEFGLQLDASPSALREAYARLRESNALPESGIVAAADLEAIVQGALESAVSFRGALTQPPSPVAKGEKLAEPEWTDGDDPRAVMQQL